MKPQHLYYIFLVIFVLTAIVTLLGVVGFVTIKDTYLNALLGGVIIGLVGAVIGLFQRTQFFTMKDTSLSESLGFAVDSFDRLSDEIEAAITNQPPPVGPRAHRFLIRRIGNDLVAYQQMEEFSADKLDQLPPDVRRQIRTYESSMKTLEKDWERIKRTQASSQLHPEVRKKQLELIRVMKSDLVGIVNVLQSVGFHIQDHYEGVRSLIEQL